MAKYSFARASKQADRFVKERLILNKSRHEYKQSLDRKTDNIKNEKIHSLNSMRTVKNHLTQFTQFIKDEKLGDLKSATPEIAKAFLEAKTNEYTQTYLRNVQHSVERATGRITNINGQHWKAKSIKSETGELAKGSRAYTRKEYLAIREKLPENMRLATDILINSGGRVTATMTVSDSTIKSAHREWSDHRFDGRPDDYKNNSGEYNLITLQDKGKISYEIALKNDDYKALKKIKLDYPQQITHHGIRMIQEYNLPHPALIGEVFTKASIEVIGYSNGIHGLRHTHAQERQEELVRAGYEYHEAKAINAQEHGHFDAEKTNAYLK
jgi:hypothetical protein